MRAMRNVKSSTAQEVHSALVPVRPRAWLMCLITKDIKVIALGCIALPISGNAVIKHENRLMTVVSQSSKLGI
jgi:hypothetical protein